MPPPAAGFHLASAAMNEKPSIEEVFANRAKMAAGTMPVFALLCRTVAADPALAAATATAETLHWGAADALMTAIAVDLRENPHPLAGHLPTLGGKPGPDDAIVAAFTDLVRTRHDALTALCATGDARWNDPAGAAFVHPAATRVAATEDRPLALIELGAAAGLTLHLDNYGYDYGTTVVGPDRPVVIGLELRGETPTHLHTPLTIASRTAIDLDPVDVTDPAHLAWLRASVRFDLTDQLDRLDRAVPITAADPPHWIKGDLIDVLPTALATIPKGHLPVIYGSTVLCCIGERRERLPRVLEDAGRDLVWISRELPANALALVASTDGHGDKDGIITTVTYQDGHATDATVLGTADWYGRWLHWNPRPAPLIT